MAADPKMNLLFTEGTLSAALLIAAICADLLCLIEFVENAGDIFHRLLSWRSAVQWIPQTCALGVTITGIYCIKTKKREYHLKIAIWTLSWAIPFAWLNICFAVIRTSYTLCCCTASLCMIRTYRKTYFTLHECDQLSESWYVDLVV